MPWGGQGDNWDDRASISNRMDLMGCRWQLTLRSEVEIWKDTWGGAEKREAQHMQRPWGRTAPGVLERQ